jgi:hypothetical protein
MNSKAAIAGAMAVLSLIGWSASNGQGAPKTDYKNGVYITSQLAPNGDGVNALAICQSEAQTPQPPVGTGDPTLTATEYAYVSSYCVVTDSSGNQVSASEALTGTGNEGCSKQQKGDSDPWYELGYLIRGNPTGDCKWTFPVQPGETYTLTTQHVIWPYNNQTAYFAGQQFLCPWGYYYDYEDFWEVSPPDDGDGSVDSGSGLTFPVHGGFETYDIYNDGPDDGDITPSKGGCLSPGEMTNPASAGALLLATTSAVFAAIGATPENPANLYQTQQLVISSNLSALQAIAGSGDSIQWCIEAPLGIGGTGNCTMNATTSPEFGTLTPSDNDANVVTYGAPDPIPTNQENGGPAAVYVCAQETMNDQNFTCLPIHMTQLAISLTPAALSLNYNGKATLIATVNSSSASTPPVPIPAGQWTWSSSIDLSEGEQTWAEAGSSTVDTLPVQALQTDANVTLTVTAIANLNYNGMGGTSSYPLTASVPISISQSYQPQTITFPAPNSPVIYGVAPITLSATASSGLPVSFSVLSGPATVSGATLSFTGVGTVVVAADQPGNSTYAAAPEVTHSIVVTLAGQASMSSPQPGTQLPGANVTFTWALGQGPTLYELYLGSTGVGSSDLYISGQLSNTTTSANVTGLPTYGESVYARLWSKINNTWVYTDYTYTMPGSPTQASMTSPQPGTQLPGASVTFTWALGQGPTLYELYLGSTGVGSSNLYISGQLSNTTTSVNVTGLPTYGEPVYARLWSKINNTWVYTDYTYTMAGSPTQASMSSPQPGTQLSGANVTFTWALGQGPTLYELYLG